MLLMHLFTSNARQLYLYMFPTRAKSTSILASLLCLRSLPVFSHVECRLVPGYGRTRYCGTTSTASIPTYRLPVSPRGPESVYARKTSSALPFVPLRSRPEASGCCTPSLECQKIDVLFVRYQNELSFQSRRSSTADTESGREEIFYHSRSSR